MKQEFDYKINGNRKVQAMAKRIILTEGDATLRKTARPVEKFDERLWDLLDDMKETLADYGGVGLAAPQVGVLRRVFITWMDEDGECVEYINPEIIFSEDEEEGREGCLSIPGKWGIVKRPHHVKVRAQDRNGEFFEREGFEMEAVCMNHENDHLNGVLYIDKVIRMIDPNEDDLD